MVEISPAHWAIWDSASPANPIDVDGFPAIFDTRRQARLVRDLMIKGGETRTLTVRPYMEHHAGDAYPGTIEITFMPPK